jgi:hypothetical protein
LVPSASDSTITTGVSHCRFCGLDVSSLCNIAPDTELTPKFSSRAAIKLRFTANHKHKKEPLTT